MISYNPIIILSSPPAPVLPLPLSLSPLVTSSLYFKRYFPSTVNFNGLCHCGPSNIQGVHESEFCFHFPTWISLVTFRKSLALLLHQCLYLSNSDHSFHPQEGYEGEWENSTEFWSILIQWFRWNTTGYWCCISYLNIFYCHYKLAE